MLATTYAILHHGARDWPPYCGDRPKQRETIRRNLQTLRFALMTPGGHVHIGRGGVTLHFQNFDIRRSPWMPRAGVCRLSGYGFPHVETALAAMAHGLPWLDTRPVENPWRLADLPMVAVGHEPDPEPWGALSYAPLAHVARLYAALGARVGNIDLSAS